MKLIVGYNFDLKLLDRMANIPEVKEVYGKMSTDCIGGGRSNYTLKYVGRKELAASVEKTHQLNLKFNYLLNAACLYGIEQTRVGQRRIRNSLDRLSEIGVDSITVASPYLLRLIKSQYPQFKVKIGAFAVVDNAFKAHQWQEMGADVLCISAIACNRNFEVLQAIRSAVKCECMLIANASCIQSCPLELTHMHILSNSSRKGDPLNGFCFDYCFLHCSKKRLADPVNYLRSVWIRPEDLNFYEALGYSSFKIVERSCPTDLIVKRTLAYTSRSFDGNLLELVGQVATIKKELNASVFQRLRMLKILFKPSKVKIRSLLLFKKYAEQVIMHDYAKNSSSIYIDNKKLNGFIEGLKKRNCTSYKCPSCNYCKTFVRKAIRINGNYRSAALKNAEKLDQGLFTGEHW